MEYVYAARFDPQPDGSFLVSFPDVPEAITQGDDLADARASAADALALALRGYLAGNRAVPKATARGRGLVEVPVDAATALKLAVVEAFGEAGISKLELARRMQVAETEAFRVLDPDHPTKLQRLQAALAVLGKQVVVTVKDAAWRHHIA